MKEQTITPAGAMRRALRPSCWPPRFSAYWASCPAQPGAEARVPGRSRWRFHHRGHVPTRGRRHQYNGKVDGADLRRHGCRPAGEGGEATAPARRRQGNEMRRTSLLGLPDVRGNKSVSGPTARGPIGRRCSTTARTTPAPSWRRSCRNGRYQYIYTSGATFATTTRRLRISVQLTIVDTSGRGRRPVQRQGRHDLRRHGCRPAEGGLHRRGQRRKTGGNDKGVLRLWGSPTFAATSPGPAARR